MAYLRCLRHIFAPLCLVVGLFVLAAGCVEIKQNDVSQLKTGLDAAKVQLDTTFSSIDQLTRDDEIEFAASQAKLNEQSVVQVVPVDVLAKWDHAFDSIDKYLAKLQSLTSPDIANDFQSSLVSFAQELKQTDPKAVPSPAIATSFAEIGSALIEFKAQKDARRIATATDPHIRAVMNSLADVIGGTRVSGYRGTVWSHWQDRIGDVQEAFLKSKDHAEKKTLVTEFLSLCQKRDANDLELANLRQSLFQVADAHAALAQGANIDLATAISLIQQQLQQTQSLYSKFKAVKTPTTGASS